MCLQVLSTKQLFRQTGSIVDYSVFLNSDNVESITLAILEDMIDVVLELGYESAQEAYEKIDETSDIIHFVKDWSRNDAERISGDTDALEHSVESHEAMCLSQLMRLKDHPFCPVDGTDAIY